MFRILRTRDERNHMIVYLGKSFDRDLSRLFKTGLIVLAVVVGLAFWAGRCSVNTSAPATGETR